MNNKINNFDFAPTINAIRPWMDTSHPDFYDLDNASQSDIHSKRHEFSQMLFNGLAEYMCGYFEYPISKSVARDIETIPTKPNGVLIIQGTFPQKREIERLRKKGNWRGSNVFALTRNETRGALVVANKNDVLALSISILGSVVVAYMKNFMKETGEFKAKQYMDERYGYPIFGAGNGSHKFLRSISQQANNTSQFLQEFLPIFSHGLVGLDDIGEQDFAQSLCTLFRNKAMQSVAYDGTIQICPFSSALAKLSRVVFEEDENGVVSLSEERRPGALFSFLYQKAQKILAEDRMLEFVSEPSAFTVDH